MRSRTQQPKRDDVGVAAYLHDGAFNNGISGPLQTGRQVRVQPGTALGEGIFQSSIGGDARRLADIHLLGGLDRDFSLDRSLEGGDEICVGADASSGTC